MRRLAGRRLGATLSLSVVLSLGAVVGTPASVQAAGRPDSVDAGLRKVSAADARAAAEVELPRPVRGAHAVRLLGDQLDEAAALNDLTEAELTDLLTTDRSAWLDLDGVVFFKEETALSPADDPVSAHAPLDQTFQLHSSPGSTKTIYLDFDGGTASGTAWHTNYPATPTTQPAWDLDGDPAAFGDAERTAIQTVWRAVAEDYAPFDVDVTTADPGPAGTHRSSSADTAYGSHVLITPSAAADDAICGGCGGVAYLKVFDSVNGGGSGAGGDGYGYRQPAWVFPQNLGNSPKNIAEAASHEVGHNFGLKHDGNATQGYDTGHGAWAPIMGVGYSRAISQWSKGDYATADNQEDDVALVLGVAGPRADEAPASIAEASAVPAGTAYVTSRTDADTYLLGSCTGPVTVSATPLDTLANLDLGLTVLDAAGQVVATDDPASAQTSVSTASGMGARLSRTLAAGTYYASVDGVGNGDWTSGYDDYGSLGAYTLAATGCDGAAPAGTPSAPTSAAATPHASDPTATVSWSAPASAGSSAVTGYVLTRSGDATAVQVGPTTTSYTWTGLAPSTAYSFTITALNAQGPGSSVTVGATTAAGTVEPGVPQNVTGSWQSVPQQAVVGYSPPTTAGSYPITGYDILINGTALGQVTFTPVSINGLTPGRYSVGVAAVSAAGRGSVATVTVVVPPRAANDAFVARTTMSGTSGSVSGDNAESTAESGEPAPPAVRSGVGAASVWYSWTAPTSGSVAMSTGSAVAGRDTTLAVYTGTSVGALTQVAGNDDASGTSRLSSVQFTATAGTTYAVAVNGYRTLAAGVGAFTLVWAGTASTATTTTLSSVVSGRSATLTAGVTATSGTPAGNVEFRDGTVLVSTQPLGSGSATVVLNDLVKGDHPLRATFVPTNSALFATSQSALVTSTIAATTSTTTLTATGGTQAVGLSAGVTVPAGTATGTVEFREGSTTVGSAAVAGGAASVSLTGVTTGPHTYTAVFLPADAQRYDGSSAAPVHVTVAAPVGTPLPTPTPTPTPTPPPAPVLSASSTAITAPKKARPGTRPVVAVKVMRGSVAASGSVVVTVGKTSRTLSLRAGAARLKLPRVKAGKVKITVRYLGNATTTSSTAKRTIKVVTADVALASRVVAPRSRASTRPLRTSTSSSATLSRTAVSSDREKDSLSTVGRYWMARLRTTT